MLWEQAEHPWGTASADRGVVTTIRQVHQARVVEGLQANRPVCLLGFVSTEVSMQCVSFAM